MDFAKKQMEKFGWKEGTGLGKNEQGMLAAIKPTLKVGKEGMGYDFSKELVDTWWTRAYDDSLKRINVDVDSSTNETVGVVLQDDEDDNDSGSLVKDSSSERPFQKMRKRMMKATFTTFSKGATLSNGELIAEEKASDSDHSADNEDSKTKSNEVKSLTDDELFKACGGRTAHKAARFGLKLNGKLARIEAQEKATKSFLSKYTSFKISTKKGDDDSPKTEPEDDLRQKDLKKKKKSKKDKAEDISAEDEVESSITAPPPSTDLSVNKDEDEISSTEGRKKKKKSSKKRKHEVIEVEPVDSIANNNDDAKEDTISEDLPSIKKHSKKSKKHHKKSKYYKDDDESCALLSS